MYTTILVMYTSYYYNSFFFSNVFIQLLITQRIGFFYTRERYFHEIKKNNMHFIIIYG